MLATCIVIFYPDFAGPSALTVNITKNIESSSIIVQWDMVDDFTATTYIIIWSSIRDGLEIATVIEHTSYTITGLAFDTDYTISVTAVNKCGQGPEFSASIQISTGTWGCTYHFQFFYCMLLLSHT